MYCARCKRELIRSRDWTWTILPGRYRRVPTCRDDRLCYTRTSSVRSKPRRVMPRRVMPLSPKMTKVRELAARFAS